MQTEYIVIGGNLFDLCSWDAQSTSMHHNFSRDLQTCEINYLLIGISKCYVCIPVKSILPKLTETI